MFIITCIWTLSLFSEVTSKAPKEGLVIGGEIASINKYPHAAFLKVKCVNEDGRKGSWMCGSSVLNRKLLITAAHCVYFCSSDTRIMVHLGDEDKHQGIVRSASGFIVHAKFNQETYECDIALVRLSRPVKFSKQIKRVAIMKKPPYSEPAHLAGWGVVNKRNTLSDDLKEVKQKVWKHIACKRKFDDMPRGTICASSPKRSEYPAQGDSGSGLLVRGFIQIGVVSYKSPTIDKSVIVYTDVGFYYDWIAFSAKKLFCLKGNTLP